MKFHLFGALLLATLSLTGCKEYYTVDDACDDKLPGGKDLTPLVQEAMTRMNCYRRLAGLSQGNANELVQKAADGEVNYVLLNPDYQVLISDIGPVSYLTQKNEEPGFTGISVYERLTADPATGGAGYSLLDPATTGYWEFILIDVASKPEDLKTGAEAIDELMRLPVFRQTALQPSWIDGAYAEADLDQQWFADGGFNSFVSTGGGESTSGTTTSPTTPEPAPTVYPFGRVYYMVVLYQAPHFEHVSNPVLYPKEDQKGVPLYSWSQNRDLISGGVYAPTQIGYPVTLTMGAIDPENYNPVDQNQYNAQITGASIVGAEGPLETDVVHPGDDPVEVWPSGQFQRTTLAVFTRRPLAPSTTYDVFIDLVSPEGSFTIDYKFETAAEDPGLDLTIGQAPGQSSRRAADLRLRRFSSWQTPPLSPAVP